MERVTFLIERTDRHITCLLNPDSVVLRRSAGVHARRSLSARITDPEGTDDPLLFTGGGVTELELELLFDIGLEGSSIETHDVRDLTGPLWALSENIERDEGRFRPPLVRFVWGKAWNIPGVITAVSERLERFDAGGAPSRSWLSMRLVRTAPRDTETHSPGPPPLDPPEEALGSDELVVHDLSGAEGESSERLDELALHYYGDPAWWRVLAELNNIDDPHHLEAGRRLNVPPASAIQSAAQRRS